MCASAPYKDTEIGEHNRERPMKSFHEEDQAGPSRSSSSEPRGPSIPRFPAALQVGVIRAHEKDEGYIQRLYSQCHDAVQRIFGARYALVWHSEIKVMTLLVYYALTVGAQQATLGEEYCGIMQVTYGTQHRPGKLRAQTLALMQALAPYVAERMQRIVANQEQDASAEEALLMFHAEQSRLRRRRKHSSLEDIYEVMRTKTRLLMDKVWNKIQSRVPQIATVLHFIVENQTSILRLHLALFYVFGVYFEVPKRIARIAHINTKAASTGQSSYRVLGILLLVQSAIAGSAWAFKRYAGKTTQMKQKTNTFYIQQNNVARVEGFDGEPLGSLLVTEPNNAAAETRKHKFASQDNQSSSEPQEYQKCPLCLSRRKTPTSTPCGHVFCWYCISEWCSQKPECPLCRSSAPASQLARVQCSDF